MTFAMLIITILSCALIFLICILIQNSYALYFGHDIPIVTNLGNSSILPIQIAATEKGDMYLTWVDNNNIYFTSSHSNGDKFSPPILLADNKTSSSISSSSSSPQIAATEKGDVYLTWVHNNNIYFTSSHNNGDKFSAPILLADNNTSSSISSSSALPQIAATEKGDVYVVWIELNNSTGDSNIEFINSNNGGKNFTAKKELRAGDTLSFSPQIAATEKGDVYVVWVDKSSKTGDTDITFRSSNDSGKNFTVIKELRGGDTLSFSPQIAATEKGDVYVVWVDKSSKTGDTDITFRSSNDSGKNFDDRERIRRNNLLSSSPQVTATENGGVYLVWTDKNNTTTNSQISFRSSSDSGKNFERIINLNKDEKNLLNSSSPQIVATSNNSAFVVWVDNHIQFKEILVNDHLVGVPISLSNKTITSLSPQITVANNGNVYAFWIDKDGIMDRSIHFKRISEDYFDRNS